MEEINKYPKNEEEIRVFYYSALLNEEEIRVFYYSALLNEEEIRFFYYLALLNEEEIRKRWGRNFGQNIYPQNDVINIGTGRSKIF